MKLALALADYDGKQVVFLESLRDRFAPEPEVLTEAVELVNHADDTIATGATWLLRAYMERGAQLSSDQHGTLAGRLATVRAPWARLHLCQTVHTLDLSSTREATAWAAFLTSACSSQRPFERAWAVDGLVRLGRRFDAYRDPARNALESALTDPAPSVRARARRLATGD